MIRPHLKWPVVPQAFHQQAGQLLLVNPPSHTRQAPSPLLYGREVMRATMKTLFITLTCVLSVSLALQVQPLLSAGLADRPGVYSLLSRGLNAEGDSTVTAEGDSTVTDTTSSTVTGSSTTPEGDPTTGSTIDFGSTDFSTEEPVSTTTTTTTTTASPKQLSGGAIAGIVIGSIAGVALIAGGIYFMKVKKMLCFA
nr:uncharacterized protein LOC123748649 [Procambarus clarkii]